MNFHHRQRIQMAVGEELFYQLVFNDCLRNGRFPLPYQLFPNLRSINVTAILEWDLLIRRATSEGGDMATALNSKHK